MGPEQISQLSLVFEAILNKVILLKDEEKVDLNIDVIGLVVHGDRYQFAIGTDAHNKRLAHNESGKGIGWFQAKSSLPWLGTTEETVALLRKYGIDERNLWIPHLGRVMK